MRPWHDTLDDGSPYPRNTHTNVCGSSAVPEELQRMPFGYGASIFDLGQQPAFVRALLGDGGGSEAVAKAMAKKETLLLKIKLLGIPVLGIV